MIGRRTRHAPNPRVLNVLVTISARKSELKTEWKMQWNIPGLLVTISVLTPESKGYRDSAVQRKNARRCEDFRNEHRRSPKLWVDKVCIDQANIAEDLECLPVFLAGCNCLLILSGMTYTSRLSPRTICAIRWI